MVLVGESAGDLLPEDPGLGEVDWFRRVGAGLSWGELSEGTVRPGIVIVQQVFGQDPSQMVLVDVQYPVRKLPAQGAGHPSQIAFARGACGGLARTLMGSALNTAWKSWRTGPRGP